MLCDYNPIVTLLLQVDWDTYGADWEGPVSTDDDITRVTIEELEELLDESQRDELQTVLSPLSGNDFSEQGMIGQFALAKSFVYQSRQT